MDAARAVAVEARGFRVGLGNWDLADAAMKRMLEVGGVKPQELFRAVTDYSMRRWFDGWALSPGALQSWDYHEPVVYFISTDEGRQVKIGTTHCLRRRLAVLRSNMPTPLRLEAAFPGSYDRERQLHRIFQADRIRGEWFQWTPEMQHLIDVVLNAYKVSDA